DPEVSEAIDFSVYYAHSARMLDAARSKFTPHEVTVVTPPWNFPIAIPTGGMMAALAAGSAVIIKPAPQVVHCAKVVVEAIHTALEAHDFQPTTRVFCVRITHCNATLSTPCAAQCVNCRKPGAGNQDVFRNQPAGNYSLSHRLRKARKFVAVQLFMLVDVFSAHPILLWNERIQHRVIGGGIVGCCR